MDKENQQGFFACERNSDYFFSSRINFCILVFLLFLYHSFHYPCYYFEIFDCRFLAFIDWLFTTCVFVTLTIIGTTLVCSWFGSHVLVSKILTCFFLFQVIQRCDMLYLDYYWISCRELRVGEDFYGGEAG